MPILHIGMLTDFVLLRLWARRLSVIEEPHSEAIHLKVIKVLLAHGCGFSTLRGCRFGHIDLESFWFHILCNPKLAGALDDSLLLLPLLHASVSCGMLCFQNVNLRLVLLILDVDKRCVLLHRLLWRLRYGRHMGGGLLVKLLLTLLLSQSPLFRLQVAHEPLIEVLHGE